jgi:undecaprenyl-diphosphatase
VLTEAFFGIHEADLTFEIWLHLATLIAVLIALRHEVFVMARSLLPKAEPAVRRGGHRLILGLIVGTIPAVLIGLFAMDAVEASFESVTGTGIQLLVTAGILAVTPWLPSGTAPISGWRALLIGIAQAIAILPGVSRSGITLAAGLATGLSARDAARFSFLLSVPAILGGAVLEAGALAQLSRIAAIPLVLGFLASGISGYLAIRAVWRIMERGKLAWFAPYCALLGIATILWARTRS